jgi:hypothetical protein
MNLNSVKKHIRKEIKKLNQALSALENIGEKKLKQARKMSAAGRKRIAKAQRARWAKIRAGKK